MVHLYDSEFFNTKITQFDSDHIQIDFSSLVFERGSKHETSDSKLADSNSLGSQCDIVSSEISEDLVLSGRQYSSASRTKRGVYNVARSNKWDWFVTFTFDNKVVDRSNFDLCKKKFSYFWNNLKKKYPDLSYLFIVEMHKNLQGFHYHGIISGIPDHEFKYFRKVRGSWNKKTKKYNYYDAWNLEKYKLGFDSCCRILDQGAVIGYVCKYITKSAILESRLSEKFKHLYFHSNNLRKPDIKRVCIDTKKEDIYQFIEDHFPDFEVVYNKVHTCSYNGSWIDYIQLQRRTVDQEQDRSGATKKSAAS